MMSAFQSRISPSPQHLAVRGWTECKKNEKEKDMTMRLASLPVAAIATAAVAGITTGNFNASAQNASPQPTVQKQRNADFTNGGWTGLYDTAAGPLGAESYSNRLELRYPGLTLRYGPGPLYWPDEAFRGIDCDLPSAGCPTTASGGN